MLKLRRFHALSLGIVLTSGFCHAADYQRLPIPAGNLSAIPNDVNTSGVAVGQSSDAFHVLKPTIWRAGAAMELPGLLSGEALAINDAEDIAGTGVSPTTHLQVPMLWDNGVPRELPHLGSGGSARDINEQGHVVGWVMNQNHIAIPAIWKDGNLELLDSPLPHGGIATSVSDTGEVGGLAYDYNTGETKPMSWVNGIPQELSQFPIPEGIGLWTSISASGGGKHAGSVFRVTPGGLVQVPVVWEDGMVRELDSLASAGYGSSQVLGASSDGRYYGFGPSVEVGMVPMVWTSNGSMRLPCEGTGIATAGSSTGTVVGYLHESNGSVPVMWQLPAVEQLQSTPIQASLGQTITLRARAMRGNQVLRNRSTEMQIDGETVARVVTNNAGVASTQVRIPNTMSVGNHSVMLSLGGSRYIFRNLVVGRASTDVAVRPVAAAPGQSTTLRASVQSPDLQAPVANARVRFLVNGRNVGQAMTTRSGVATLPYRLPANTNASRLRIEARFEGDRRTTGTVGTGALTIRR